MKFGSKNLNLEALDKMKEKSESPFIQLTANPALVDVLCINCYQCIPFAEVNSHSIEC